MLSNEHKSTSPHTISINPVAEMVVMVVVAGVAKVRISASNVREAFTTRHTMPCHVVVQAHGSTVALRHRGSIKTLEAPEGAESATLGFKQGPKAMGLRIVLPVSPVPQLMSYFRGNL